MIAYFDFGTVILYLIISLLGVFLIGKMMQFQKNISNGLIIKSKQGFFIPMAGFVLLYALLAALRTIGGEIGGSDSIAYVRNFDTILSGSIIEFEQNRGLEWGFQSFTAIIRSITSSHRLYFLIVYGFISLSYVKFIKEKCPPCQSYIPYILLMYPFLRSFNTLRTGMAVGIVLLGLIIIDKKKYLSLALLILSILFHRMSVVVLLIWPFYYFFKDSLGKINRKWFFIYVVIGVIITSYLSVLIQANIGDIDVLDGRDQNFATSTMGENHFERYPLVLGQLLLFGVLMLYYGKIEWTNKNSYLRSIFIYDMWLVPVIVVLGVWRAVEYFYVVRLALWCIIINSLILKNRKDKLIINLAALTLFSAWLIFRIYKENEAICVSPYIFDFSWII